MRTREATWIGKEYGHSWGEREGMKSPSGRMCPLSEEWHFIHQNKEEEGSKCYKASTAFSSRDEKIQSGGLIVQ